MRTKWMAMAGAVVLGGSCAASGAQVDYDLGLYDFGTGDGKIDHLDHFSALSNFNASFTDDSLVLMRDEEANAIVSFFPDNGFNLDGSTGVMTIDIAVRRIGDVGSTTQWDFAVETLFSPSGWPSDRRFDLGLRTNDTTSPSFDSNPSTSEMNIYRLVFGLDDLGAGDARYFVNDDEVGQARSQNGWINRDDNRLRFRSMTDRTGEIGGEIAWIGISSEPVNAPIPEPGAAALLGVGSLLLMRRRR